MSIPALVTGGFGNGTFTSSVAEVVTAGYGIGDEVIVPAKQTLFTAGFGNGVFSGTIGDVTLFGYESKAKVPIVSRIRNGGFMKNMGRGMNR